MVNFLIGAFLGVITSIGILILCDAGSDKIYTQEEYDAALEKSGKYND